MDENELVRRHLDHNKGRNIKNQYLISILVLNENLRIPLAYEAVKRTVVFSKIKPGMIFYHTRFFIATSCFFVVPGKAI